MRRNRRPLAILLGTALALVLSLALAPYASAATPVERHRAWADNLQSVLDNSPDLTAEEVSALAAALREVGPGAFADDASPVDREILERNADALNTALSCGAYSDMVEGFGELRSWLVEEDIFANAATCNCGGDDDCGRGYYCNAVNCTSPQGTTHWGRCASGDPPTEIEPFPVEPTDVLDR